MRRVAVVLLLAAAGHAQKQPVWWQCEPCAATDPLYRTLGSSPAGDGLMVNTAREVAAIVQSNYDYAPIFVARLLRPSNTWLIALSGMQLFRQDQATGATQALAAAFGAPSEYSDLIMRAWYEMRIPPDARVILAGHSLGAMESENLVIHPQHGAKVRSQVQRIVAFGAPALRYLTIDARDIRRFMYINDYILPMLRHLKAPSSHLSESFLTMIPYTRGNGDPHNSYQFSPVLDGYDAFGDRMGGQGFARSMVIDKRVMWRCRANKVALQYPHDATSRASVNPRGMPHITNQTDMANKPSGAFSAYWPDAQYGQRAFRFSTDLFSRQGTVRKAKGWGFVGKNIDRGAQPGRDPRQYQPSNSAARMTVDCMRSLRTTMPWFIRFENIVEERSMSELEAGRLRDSRMYQILMAVLEELRVKQYTIDFGRMGSAELWLQADIQSYY